MGCETKPNGSVCATWPLPIDNQETLLAIPRAAHAKRAPALAELSHAEAEVIGLANMRSLVDNYCAEYGVEVYVNLDHSPSVEAAKAGIDAGP